MGAQVADTPFYLAYENHDTQMMTAWLWSVRRYFSKSVAKNWEIFLDVCDAHVIILEDKIHDGPADESRAPELWKFPACGSKSKDS